VFYFDHLHEGERKEIKRKAHTEKSEIKQRLSRMPATVAMNLLLAYERIPERSVYSFFMD